MRRIPFPSQHRRRGVALVITLIFLSVITVMAVAFLALTRRGKVSERESNNRTIAEQMTDIGLERAKGEILGRIIATTNNPLWWNLLVSINATNKNNTTYNSPNDTADIANLLTDPRPPVFIDTNRIGGPINPSSTNEFRYYLDLNRNGRFEPSGYVVSLDYNGQPLLDTTGNPIFEFAVGDPQWIGVRNSNNPTNRHSQYNPIQGRYAYFIQPIGLSLDLNWNHNDAKRSLFPNVPNPGPGFYRNQGFGPWEINLAAFLADLNTNEWDSASGFGRYDYDEMLTINSASGGDSFFDARDLLNFRYMPTPFGLPGPFANLRSFESLYPGSTIIFTNDFIDAYANSAPPALGIGLPDDTDDDATRPWPGAPSLTNFYTVHDLFDRAANPNYTNFIGHLNRASSDLSTYDRYSFYRIAAQLGTESEPERQEKINLNYRNLGTNGPGQSFLPTDFIAWGPQDFFNTTANRLLREESRRAREREPALPRVFEFGVTNIPVYINGSRRFISGTTNRLYYSPRVQQLLQVAANIGEATRGSKVGEEFPYFPTVYQPIFGKEPNAVGDNIYVIAYKEVDGASFYTRFLSRTIKVYDLDVPADAASLAAAVGPISPPSSAVNDNILVYGVPLIIAARKGFPAFNEFTLQSAVQVSRKLEVTRATPTGRTISTNQMLIMGLSNAFTLEAWYPYTNGYPNSTYPRDLEMLTSVSSTSVLTNSDPSFGSLLNVSPYFDFRTVPRLTWGGLGTNQFRLPPITNVVVLPDSVYRQATARFETVGVTNVFDPVIASRTNHWGLTMTNRLLFFLFDRGSNGTHIVDAVMMKDLNVGFDISGELRGPSGGFGLANVWDETPYRNVTDGINNQILVATGDIPTTSAEWLSFGGFNTASGDTREKGIAAFRRFLGLSPHPSYPTNGLPPITTVQQSPFTPSKHLFQINTWQVNDPLVHYMAEDVRSPTPPQVIPETSLRTVSLLSDFNLNKVNDRYRPWWGKNQNLSLPPASALLVDARIRDPGLWNPDHYEFPTNKFPNIGWLGRVHRGTPWQTIYLKGDAATPAQWMSTDGPGYDMTMHPTNDWWLVDQFTVALNADMTRGRLSVNQTNVAAWSAVLSGVAVTTLQRNANGNIVPADYLIQPASKESPVARIVESINAARATRTNGQFTCLGDVLSSPALSSRSPFLEEPFVSNAAYSERDKLLRDVDYERIPQQVLSLLKLGEPRFVIYAFGQSLIPSSVVQGGPNIGMPNNYRITGEYASRAVVRVVFDPLPIGPGEEDYGLPDYTRPHLVVEKYNILPLY